MNAFKIKRKEFKTIMLFFIFVFSGLTCQAQYSKDEMVRWFKNKGGEYLARFAHPNPSNNYLSYNIISESKSCISVEIFYRGIFAGYSCKYDVYIDTTKEGVPYFSKVVCSKEGCKWADCFQNWDYGSYPRNYTNYSSFYGSSSFHNLSNGQKAAFALWYEFIDR